MRHSILLAIALTALACSASPEDSATVDNPLAMPTCYSAGRMRLVTPNGWFTRADGVVGYEGDVQVDGQSYGRAWLQLWSDGSVISCGLLEPAFDHNQWCIDVVHLGQEPGC